MPLYVAASSEGNTQCPPGVPTFYVDDSACEIGGIRHTLVGAIGFYDERGAIADVLRCKGKLGLRPQDEIKWNSKSFTPGQRHSITEKILPVLNTATGFLVVTTDSKQFAAKALANQLSDYCRLKRLPGFVCRFDKNILSDRHEYDRHAYSLSPPCAGWSEVDSLHDQLIQCADLFVGFQKLRIDFGLGTAEPGKMVEVEVYEGVRDEYELWWYLFAALRHSLWGEVEEPHTPGEPWKNNLGLGLRVYSNVPKEIMQGALSYISREFLGCIH